MRAQMACIAAAVLFAACSKGDNAATDTAAAGASAAAAATPAPAPAPLTDANIVAKLGMADSGEVAVARMAAGKATNSGVKSYAQMLVTDHTAHAKEVASTATKAAVTPAAPPNDASAQEHQQAMERLNTLTKGADFDTAFVNAMVADHQKMISEVQSLEQQSQQADVKGLLTKTLPALQKHLDRGQALQATLTKSGTKTP